MLIPSVSIAVFGLHTSLSRRVNANSQHVTAVFGARGKLIKKGEC